MAPKSASLFDPDNQKAGGFFDDVDATIVGARVGTWAEAEGKCLMILTLRRDGADEGEEDRTEYYTIGDLDKFTPSKDGKSVVYDEGTKMINSTKAALFFKALINAGFDRSKLSDDLSYLEGVHAHFKQIDMEIKGDSRHFKKKAGKEGDDNKRKPSVLVVVKLLDGAAPAKPAGGGAAAAAAPAKTAAAAAPAASGADDSTVEEILVAILGEQGGTVAKKTLPALVFKATGHDADVRRVSLKLAGDANWLAGEGRPWTYKADTGELSLG